MDSASNTQAKNRERVLPTSYKEKKWYFGLLPPKAFGHLHPPTILHDCILGRVNYYSFIWQQLPSTEVLNGLVIVMTRVYLTL